MNLSTAAHGQPWDGQQSPDNSPPRDRLWQWASRYWPWAQHADADPAPTGTPWLGWDGWVDTPSRYRFLPAPSRKS